MESITPLMSQEMARYRATARRRETERREALSARRRAAWETARRAAALLKREYGVRRVLLLGSLSRDEPFSAHSDIDLAVWGLDARLYYRVVSRLQDLDPSVSIDLLCAETLREDLARTIETSGISL